MFFGLIFELNKASFTSYSTKEVLVYWKKLEERGWANGEGYET